MLSVLVKFKLPLAKPCQELENVKAFLEKPSVFAKSLRL